MLNNEGYRVRLKDNTGVFQKRHTPDYLLHITIYLESTTFILYPSSFTLHPSSFTLYLLHFTLLSFFQSINLANLPFRGEGHAESLDLQRVELTGPVAVQQSQIQRRLGGPPRRFVAPEDEVSSILGLFDG